MKIRFTIIAFVIFQIASAQNFKFGKVSKEELSEKSHPLDPSANAAILYREYKTHFEYSSEEGFYYETEVFERIKIYNKDGYDEANFVIPVHKGNSGYRESFSGLKAYTYHLANNKVEKIKLKNEGIFKEAANKYLDIIKFTLPDLKEGCVIEYKYTLKSPFISSINTFYFQEEIPVNKVNFDFRVPEYLNYKTHQKGSIPFKIEKDGKDRTLEFKYLEKAILSGGVTDKTVTSNVSFIENIYRVNLDNVPAVKKEAFSGNLSNFMSSIKFELSYTKYPGAAIKSYATDWNFVAKSIYESPSFGDELRKTNYFKADIDNLLSGVSDNNQKMALIFNYVKSRMNWNEYIGKYVNEGVKSAYKSKVGNSAEINLMLTAMFRYAKLNANPILVSTKSNGVPLFPTRNGFNYVISGVEVNNGVLLFDATNKLALPNILDQEVMNWQGRLIRQDGSSTWVGLISNKHALRNAMINANITEEFNIKGNLKQRLTDHYAFEAREEFINLNEEDIRKSLEKNKIETELSNVEIKDLKDLSKPVSISYDFETFNLVEEISGKLYFSPMLFLGEKGNPFTLEERDYPVDFGYPKKMRAIISISIPEGYSIESMPESTSFSFGENDAVFRYKISQASNKVQLSIEFTINQPLISPSDYKNLKGFYQLMVEKQNEKVVLTKI